MEVLYPYEGKPSWPVTARGLHLKPAAHHTDWLGERRDYELGILKRIGASWVTMITDGDSALEVIDGKEAVRWLLDAHVVPIIRDGTTLLPRPYSNLAFVERLVSVYAEYGLRPTVIPWNEPGDVREWVNKYVPPDWKEKFMGCWVSAARQILSRGCNVAFPDPLGNWAWFFSRFPPDIVDAFRDRRAVIAAHLYGKARPVDYPEDDVSRHGTRLSLEAWKAQLDDFWFVPGYKPYPLDEINAARVALRDPNRTFLDDSTCFGAWRNIYYWFETIHGFRPAMCMTEGGWTPKDIAGSGPDCDRRFPPSTLKAVGRRALEALACDHGMYALTFWLAYGWSDDGWYYNGLSNAVYGSYETPAIAMLEQSDDQIISKLRQDVAALRGLI